MRHFAVAAVVAVTRAGHAVAEEPTLTLDDIAVDDPVTTMASTEDGKFLVLAHQAKNRLAFWDVAGGRVVKKVDCAAR